MTRHALAEAYRSLGQQRLIEGSAGNISVRTSSGMLISPTRTTPEQITPEAFIDMPLNAAAPGASSEWFFHAAIYQDRPDIQAIVHTHSDHCTALACLNRALPAFHYMVGTFGGDDVRCAPYVTFGTPMLATLAVDALRGRTACLLANHGMIATGLTLEKAMTATRLLEQLARQYLLCLAAGVPRLLTTPEMAEAHDRFRSY